LVVASEKENLMSKRLIGVVVAAVCAAGFVVPSTASAVTRAVGEGVYAKGPNGWIKDCRAVPVGAYVVRITQCYVEETAGSARLCAQIHVQTLGEVITGGGYTGTLQCSDPNAPGAATAGAFRFGA
jgi:hypothetical protein